ncbi:MAG: sensor histidine kinase [Candidatus Dormibacteria bacterium]|jgi:signal transduction histidine kinase
MFVMATWLVAVTLALTVMPWNRDHDWVAAAVAGPLVAVMAAYAIPRFGGIRGQWSASGFFHLAFSFAIGPPAILTMAIGQSAGSALRRRPGAFRTIFNAGDHFLADTAAWLVFVHAGGPSSGVIPLALAGAAGAVAESIVNLGLIGVVVSLAGEPSGLQRWLRSLASTASIALLFGITAAGATLLYTDEKTFGIVTLLLPLALVQGSLVTLARRTHEQALVDEARRREREGLLRREAQALRRAADASEVERKRIAADLHDSVIQDVTGLLLRSSAMLGRLSDGDSDVWSRERVEGFLNYTRDLAGGAVQELRTLMIELAPPLLDEEGLASALRQLLTRLDREQISWVLECTEERLDQRQQRLVYRVVQEALRNAIKHAQCHSVWVTVRPRNGRLVASVRDDGRGFSAAERAERRKKGHAGLGLLEQTVRDGGGELRITSVRGKGTTLRLVIPMPLSPALEGEGGDGAGVSAASDGRQPGDDGDDDGQAAESRPPATASARSRKSPEHAGSGGLPRVG